MGRVWVRTHACAFAYPHIPVPTGVVPIREALMRDSIVTASCCDTGGDCYNPRMPANRSIPKLEKIVQPHVLRSLRALATLRKSV